MSRRLMLHSQSDPLMLTDILCLDGIENTLEGHKSNTGYYWWDLSGNGNHFYRNDRQSQTNWTENARVFYGNTRDTLWRSITLPSNTDFSIEVVAAPTDYGGTYGGESYAWIFSNRTGHNSSYVQAIAAKNKDGIHIRSFDYANLAIISNPVELGITGHQVFSFFDGTATYFFNGEQVYSLPTSIRIPLTAHWVIGAWDNNYFLKGKVYRIGIHSRAFTAAEAASRWRYFQERFGE